MLLSGTKVMKKRIMREEIRMENIGIVILLWYICTLVNK